MYRVGEPLHQERVAKKPRDKIDARLACRDWKPEISSPDYTHLAPSRNKVREPLPSAQTAPELCDSCRSSASLYFLSGSQLWRPSWTLSSQAPDFSYLLRRPSSRQPPSDTTRQRARPFMMGSKSRKRSRSIVEENRAECPFTVSMTVAPRQDRDRPKTKKQKRDGQPEEEKKAQLQNSPFAPTGKFKTNETMDCYYSVEPRKRWTDMTRYNSFVREFGLPRTAGKPALADGYV